MDDLISEFITETSESIAVLDQELVRLERNPDNPEILGNIFRLMHTIKGTCGFLGLPRLEKVAHASENILGKIRDGSLQVSPQAISLVLESIDAIKQLMEHLSAHGQEPEGDDKELTTRLNAFAEGGGGEAAAPAPAVEETASEPVPEAMPEAEAKEAPPEAAVPAAAPDLSTAAKEKAIAQGLQAEPKDGGGGGGANAATQSIRVNLDVLENLMQMVSELVLTRNQLLQMVRSRNDSEFVAPLQRLSHITSELQEGIMKTRMQPIGNAWAKFPRLVRDLAIDLGKKIELRMVGAETELDRQLLEMIKDPLTHMVRNSADHGLERPADRIAAGKSETGVVTLSAYHEGGHIMIEIGDDGRGINIVKIKEKIIGNHLATEAELGMMSDQQIMQYIFKAGFSTAEKVTSVSGRGVGMDVVKTNIEKIGGTIELRSQMGKGSTFVVKIPLTLAIVSVLIVEAGSEKFAIPQISVDELVRASPRSGHTVETINGSPVLRLREKLLPLLSLPEILRVPSSKPAGSDETYIVVCTVGTHDFGLIVDRVFDTEEIVVKPVSSIIAGIDIYSGCTILGDGSVIMILDLNGLARTTGELQVGSRHKEEAIRKASLSERVITFLVFRAGEGAPKAVPLEVVSRLEEIDASTLEQSGDATVVQYRGGLMRLITLDGSYAIPTEGMIPAIVFSYESSYLGLVVEEITDIVDERLAVKVSSKEPGYLGSMVISGKATDIIDAGYILSNFVGTLCEADSAREDEEGGALPPRILLVDDSAFFRNLTAPFLSAAGFEVLPVESVQEAWKIINGGEKIDLIVSDIEMPETNGFEFAVQCRAHPALQKMPIVAFTSRVTQEAIQRGNQVGFDAFIAKSDRDGLIKAINANLTQKEAAA